MKCRRKPFLLPIVKNLPLYPNFVGVLETTIVIIVPSEVGDVAQEEGMEVWQFCKNISTEIMEELRLDIAIS